MGRGRVLGWRADELWVLLACVLMMVLEVTVIVGLGAIVKSGMLS
jgi:hypothetical protein